MGIKIVNPLLNKEKAHYTHLYSGCAFYFNLFEFSDWFFKIQFHDILSYFTGHIESEQTF